LTPINLVIFEEAIGNFNLRVCFTLDMHSVFIK